MVEARAELYMAAEADCVAAIMFDYARDSVWIGGIRHSEPLTGGPLAAGTRVRHDGGFLWKKFSWVTEVERFEPGREMAMRFLSGPLKGRVTYRVTPQGGDCRASIHIVGTAAFAAPFMAAMMRRSIGKDLARLRRLACAT